MTREAALAAAQRYIAHCNAQHSLPPDYQWQVSEPVNYRNFWYFDYSIEHRSGRPQQGSGGMFGGAPGYIVAKHNQQIRIINWQEFSGLNKRETKLQHIEELAAHLVQRPLTLPLLRQHFRLALPQLQAFRRHLDGLPHAEQLQELQARLLLEAGLTPLPGVETDY